jgi:hypothetical protein
MPAPWEEDATAYFGDNAEALDAFHRYMTEKQQPYVTQLEEGSKDARELWTDLNTDSETTLRDLVSSVYRDQPEVVAAYEAIFAEEAAEAAEPVVAEADIPEWAKPVVAREQATRDAEIAASLAADYATLKDEVKAEHGLSDVDMTLIDPFMMITNNDGEAAVAALKKFQAAFLAAHGVEATAATVAAPPPVLGTEGSTAAAPPAKTPYQTYNQMGDALKDYQARQAASATPPPVVG